jgi:hypothetical protein
MRGDRRGCAAASELTARAAALPSWHGVELAGGLHALVLEHLVDALRDRLEVGEHAAEPTLVDVGHAALLGVAADRVLGLLLGADEHDRAAAGDEVADEGVGVSTATSVCSRSMM